MAAVSLIHIATPRAMPIIASVVRNDGMPTRVVSMLLQKPTAKPVAMPTITPRNGPPMSIAIAVVTEARPATAPIERSISPAERTKVMATAMIAIIAVWRTMLSRLLGSRKPLSCSVTAKTRKMATKPR